MPPGKQSGGRSISPSISTSRSILDVVSGGVVAVGVGARVGVGVAVGVGTTVGVEVGSAVGAGSVTVGGCCVIAESLLQPTRAAAIRTIAITRQNSFFTSDPFETIDPSHVKADALPPHQFYHAGLMRPYGEVTDFHTVLSMAAPSQCVPYSPWHVTRVAARSRPRVRTTLSTVANSGLPLGDYQVRDESLTDVFPVGRQEGWQLELLGIGRLGLAIGTLLTGGLGTITSSRLQAP